MSCDVDQSTLLTKASADAEHSSPIVKKLNATHQNTGPQIIILWFLQLKGLFKRLLLAHQRRMTRRLLIVIRGRLRVLWCLRILLVASSITLLLLLSVRWRLHASLLPLLTFVVVILRSHGNDYSIKQLLEERERVWYFERKSPSAQQRSVSELLLSAWGESAIDWSREA